MRTPFPFIGLLLAALATGAVAVAPVHADDEPEARTVIFDIVGMVSDSCPVLVKKAVRRIDGVKRVEASAKTKTVKVAYLPNRTSPEAIRKVIKDKTGFDAKIRSTE